MNYKNANNILPDRLVQEIQQYVQGEYIYIPIKDKRKGYEAMNNRILQIINEWDIEEKEVKQIYDSAHEK